MSKHEEAWQRCVAAAKPEDGDRRQLLVKFFAERGLELDIRDATNAAIVSGLWSQLAD